MEEMDAALWSGLPSEVQERALPYLSAPVLCRFRTVCKRWNSLICNPDFGALCIQNAAQDAALFLVAMSYKLSPYIGDNESDLTYVRGRNRGWIFLDVKAKRWYTIGKLAEQELYDRVECHDPRRVVAMDGALVCQVLPSKLYYGNTSVYVFIPIAQTDPVLLPSPERCLDICSVVDIVVDANTCCYTIYVLPNSRKLASERNPFMIIYESRTALWRSSSLPLITSVWVQVERTSVCFNGLLYVLAWADLEETLWRGVPPDHSWLWSYNLAEDTWKDTGVVINYTGEGVNHPTLLVSDNRLFLTLWEFKGEERTSLSIVYHVMEIDLQERKLRPVLRLTDAAIMELFAFEVWLPTTDLRAFGLDKGIMFLCKRTRITRTYDLRTCTWDTLRDNPLAPTMMSKDGFVTFFGKPMNLVMPVPSESWKKNVPEYA